MEILKLERSKNTKRNIIYGFLNQSLSLILTFVVRSVVIYRLGIEYLGINSLFSSILQVLNLAELGFGTAIVYNMYKPIAEDDKRTISALLKLYRDIYRIIGLVILAGGTLMLPFVCKLIKDDYPEDINIYIIFLIYLFNTVISYWMFAYKTSLLDAYQRTDIISKTGSITRLVINASQIIILYTLENYYIYLIMMPVCTVLNNLLNSYMVKRMFPEYKCEGILDKKILHNIKENVLGLMINRVCQTSRNSFDSIFITGFLGLTTAAIYSNYFCVLSMVISVMSVICGSMTAGVGNSIACYDTCRNYRDMKKFDFLYMWIGGWCTICLVCLMQPFMELWTGEDLMFSYDIVLMLCVYFYILQMGNIRSIYVSAAGLWWQNRYRAIVESIANIALNYILVRLWGIRGIILATLLSLLIINFGFGSKLTFREYFKNNKLWEFFGLHAIYACVTLAVGAATYQCCRLVRVDGVIGLGLKAFVCIIVPNILYLAVYYWTKMYAISVPWVLNTLHLEKVLKILIPKGVDYGK